MKKGFFLTAPFFFICFILMAQQKSLTPIQATIENGKVEGVVDAQKGLSLFLGIPYAKPPIGNLRWKAPQALENWKDVRITQQFGHAPVQTNVFGDMVYRSDSVSEDCLYLNVWASQSAKALPVLVYFYGGGFVAGDGSEPRYDGASMAQKGIVVVTVNYRLNIFGFFAHPELSKEAPYHASGNYGLLDQAFALQWVHKNIAAFGGNPQKVTIAGESAGSISVSSLMASPLSKNLIAGAIGESGAAINPTLAPVTLKEAEKAGNDFAINAGYHSVKALRELSTQEVFALYTKSNRFDFPTVIDSYFYPATLPQLYNAGEQAQIPLLVGWNSAEIPGSAFMQGLPYTHDNFAQKVEEAYPENHELVLQLYPSGSEKETERSATALASDRFIAYSTWKWFDLQRKNTEKPVYRYLFSKIIPPLEDQSKKEGQKNDSEKEHSTKAPKLIGAPHASEIPYCMGNLSLMKGNSWTEGDFKASATMQEYFANFIKTGNPNGANLVNWPKAGANDTTPPVMLIDENSKVINAPDEDRYHFLDKAYGNN